jgi:hypothetical protein
MKHIMQALALGAALLLAGHVQAQTGAPAQSKGVMVANPMAASTPGSTTAPVSVSQPAAPVNKPAVPVDQPAASGGGDDKVWVNTASNVYHCAGTRYYGKTKAGLYMTQTQARAKGHRANKTCP